MMKMKRRHVGIASSVICTMFLLTLLLNTVGIGIIDSSAPLQRIEGVHGIWRIQPFSETYDSETNEDSQTNNSEFSVKAAAAKDKQKQVRKSMLTSNQHSGAVPSLGANESGPYIRSPSSSFIFNLTTSAISSKYHRAETPKQLELILAASGIRSIENDFTQLHAQLNFLYKQFSYHMDIPLQSFGINVTKSRIISPNRILLDSRPLECKNRTFDYKLLPTVSIIIPFYNEHHSVLIRTFHSILNTVPAALLHEIILIDDFSDHADLMQPLETYTKAIPKLYLYRTTKREGLIRARMFGARIASGEVLVFIDAHVEVVNQWLEPLLLEIYKDPQTVTIPRIGHIEPDTLEPKEFNRNEYGSFSWELDFVWQDIPPCLSTKPATEPLDTATMIGCAFAVNRDYFFKLGGYDEGLDIWGGENLEISFRTWMCGGSLKVIQCSKVFHLFRPTLPYYVPNDVLHRNLQRIAAVWMDEYKMQFFYTVGKVMEFTTTERQSIADRKKLRQELHCHNFTWFLNNISPELLTPTEESVLWGQMKNLHVNGCLNVSTDGILNLDNCPLYLALQTFSYSKYNNVVHQISGQCLTVVPPHSISLATCDHFNRGQKWYYSPLIPDALNELIKGVDVRKPVGSFWMAEGKTRMCLGQKMTEGHHFFPSVSECEFDNLDQYWVFLHKMNYHLKLGE